MKKINSIADLYGLTAEVLAKATDEELRNAYRFVAEPFSNSLMDKASYGLLNDDDCKAVENAYWLINAEEDERYRRENEPKLREYFNKWFAGKSWEEIRNNEELYDNWGYYSDWHKDCFGYRPHGVVCGEYVRPY